MSKNLLDPKVCNTKIIKHNEMEAEIQTQDDIDPIKPS